MSSDALFLTALIVPASFIGAGVLSARKIKLWPLMVFAVLICWALFWLSYNATLDGTMRGSSADEDFASFLDGLFFLLGWIPASIYCGFWFVVVKFGVLRELETKQMDK